MACLAPEAKKGKLKSPKLGSEIENYPHSLLYLKIILFHKSLSQKNCARTHTHTHTHRSIHWNVLNCPYSHSCHLLSVSSAHFLITKSSSEGSRVLIHYKMCIVPWARQSIIIYRLTMKFPLRGTLWLWRHVLMILIVHLLVFHRSRYRLQQTRIQN